MFKSVDELENFSFDDCVVSKIEKAEDGLIFEVEALIVKAKNSQNSNFTDSYAGTAKIKLAGGKVENLIKCGYRYYNADSVLIKEVPDEEIPAEARDGLIKEFSGNYLVSLAYEDGYLVAEIETTDETGASEYSYLIKTRPLSIEVTWDKYLNRVNK